MTKTDFCGSDHFPAQENWHPTIKGNKIYWISHKSCRTCYHKYIKATRYCSHSYNIINNYQTWVVLLILHLKLNLEQSKHYTPQCPSGPQLNFLIFFVIVTVVSDYSPDLPPQKSFFCTRPWKVLTLQIREAHQKWMRRIPPYRSNEDAKTCIYHTPDYLQ